MTCPDGCPYGCAGYCRLHEEPCSLGHTPEPEPSRAWTAAIVAVLFGLVMWGRFG